MGAYVTIHVETFIEGSELRVRPVHETPFPRYLYVQCSKKMREMYPVGTVFELDVQLIEKSDGTNAVHLMAPHDAPYRVVQRGPREGSAPPSARPPHRTHAFTQEAELKSAVPEPPDESASGPWECPGCKVELAASKAKGHAATCPAFWLMKNPRGRL